MSVISGNPPRRSEYADVFISNYNRDTQNYYENGKFVIDVKLLSLELNTLIKNG